VWVSPVLVRLRAVRMLWRCHINSQHRKNGMVCDRTAIKRSNGPSHKKGYKGKQKIQIFQNGKMGCRAIS